MRCYTVHDQASQGLYIKPTPNGEVVVHVGDTQVKVKDHDIEREFASSGRNLLLLDHARFTKSGFLVHDRSRSNTVLVHVDTMAGEGGRLWYEANSWSEVRTSRVIRQYHEFPSAGVDVLAIGYGPGGEPHALVKMIPGASFRICRDGDLDGASPVIVVVWSGSVLSAFPPKKFQKKVA